MNMCMHALVNYFVSRYFWSACCFFFVSLIVLLCHNYLFVFVQYILSILLCALQEDDVEISPVEVDDALVIEDDEVSEDDDDDQDDVCGHKIYC